MLENFQDMQRHWCAQSELYTGCDSLLHALQDGWQAHHIATIQHHPLGSRTVKTYTITLSKGSALTTMRIVDTPMLLRVLRTHHIVAVNAGKLPQIVLLPSANVKQVRRG